MSWVMVMLSVSVQPLLAVAVTVYVRVPSTVSVKDIGDDAPVAVTPDVDVAV